jgi:hypothetical protein
MHAIQLEFNTENKTSSEMEIYYMKQLLAEMNDSMGKVRRKLFAEMGELKKTCHNLQIENLALKTMVEGRKKIEWSYDKPDHLFDIETKVVAFS